MSDLKNYQKQRPPRRGFMGHGGGVPMQGEKAQNFKTTMKKLIDYLKQYNFFIVIVIILAVLSAVFQIIGPFILGLVTTKVFEGIKAYELQGTVSIDFIYIRNQMMILTSLYMVSALFAYLQGWLMSGAAMKVTYQFRKDITKKIHRMPLKYFDSKSHGEILSRVTNDVDTVSQTLTQSLTQIVASVVTVLGVLVMMLVISPVMTIVSLLIIPLSMGFIMLIVKHSQKHFKKQQEYLGHVNGQVEENYSGHNIIQVFNGEKEAIERFNKDNEKLYEAAWKSQFLSGMMMPVMAFIGNLGYVAVCILGGYLAVVQMITVGNIQAFIHYMRQFTQPMSQLANISNTLQSTAAAAERVFEFLEEQEEIDHTSEILPIDNVKGKVTFKNVNFGYDLNQAVINNLSLEVQPGQTVAIVGPTGAGKTTIVKLLMRFYEIQSGRIYVDGYNIQDFTRRDLRKLYGMVLQDTWLYHASIMENIRYGRLSATDEEVIAAAKAAHVDSFVHALPEGYQMVLSEESDNLSEGQKQLITIARAILADPKILILDEATSSVDTRTEVFVQKAMKNLMQGRTSFVIAHRLSTIKDADLILVMKDGDIVEQGKHQELLRQGGLYAELYNSQFDKEA